MVSHTCKSKIVEQAGARQGYYSGRPGFQTVKLPPVQVNCPSLQHLFQIPAEKTVAASSHAGMTGLGSLRATSLLRTNFLVYITVLPPGGFGGYIEKFETPATKKKPHSLRTRK